MPIAKDEAGNLWEVDAQGQVLGPHRAAPPANPEFPFKGPQAGATLNSTVANTQGQQIENSVKGATAPAVVRKANADAKAAEIGAMATPGQKALDEAFAKEYADWTAGGGYSQVDRQLRTLIEQKNRLSRSNSISGPLVGSVPDFLNKWINPEAIDVRQNIEQAIQGAMRPTLGAQFTQQEGERMISRGFNPNLQEGANIPRLDSAINELRARGQSKDSAARYFEQHGTLVGWKGELPRSGGAPQQSPQRVASQALQREYQTYTAQTKNLPALARQIGLKKLQNDPRMKRLWGIVNGGQQQAQQPQGKFLGWED